MLDERGIPLRVYSTGTGVVHLATDCPILTRPPGITPYLRSRWPRDKVCYYCLRRFPFPRELAVSG